jgi:hypothetical protein
MGELSTTYPFSDLYADVADMRGKTRSPSGTDLTAAKRLVNDAYRKFLSCNDWNFLKQLAVITTANSKWEYELPDNFRELTIAFKYPADESLPNLSQISVDQLLNMRTGIADTTGQPFCFAISTSLYTPETGTRWRVLFHYPPNGTYELIYQYRIGVEELSADGDVPIGGHEHAATIREFCLSEVELWDGEEAGVHTKNVYDPNIGLLTRSKQLDAKKASRSVGLMGGGKKELTRWQNIYYNNVKVND